MRDFVVPNIKIGDIKPLSVVDYTVYEFYRIAPPGMMLVLALAGLETFQKEDAVRALEPIDRIVDAMVERQVDLVFMSGTPLAVLLGIEGHDELLRRIEDRSKVPASSSALGVVEAARHLGLGRVALANKWSDAMNRTLAAFFARAGIEVVGTSSNEMSPAEFQKSSTADSSSLAYELGRGALERFPDADGIYLGGGAWLTEHAREALEREFGKPVITNQNSMVRDVLSRLRRWKPIEGNGLVLSHE